MKWKNVGGRGKESLMSIFTEVLSTFLLETEIEDKVQHII
jgi:hypothetical protein